MPVLEAKEQTLGKILATQCDVHLVALMSNGNPQVLRVWAETDEDCGWQRV